MNILHIILLLFASGAFAGILAGLLGVGGGIILVPIFYYSFSSLGSDNGQLMQICLATSLATIIFTSIRSVLSHHKKNAVDWEILRTWAPGIIIGAIIAVFVASTLRSNTLVLLFGILGILTGFYMSISKSKWRISDTMPGVLIRNVLSTIIGFLSVLMGIGGGSFAVPLMTLHGVTVHRSVATAAGFGVLIAFPSVITFALKQPPAQGLPPFMIGYVNYAAFLIIISMTMITAPIGARISHKINPKLLKRIFGIFLIIVATNMLLKEFFL